MKIGRQSLGGASVRQSCIGPHLAVKRRGQGRSNNECTPAAWRVETDREAQHTGRRLPARASLVLVHAQWAEDSR